MERSFLPQPSKGITAGVLVVFMIFQITSDSNSLELKNLNPGPVQSSTNHLFFLNSFLLVIRASSNWPGCLFSGQSSPRNLLGDGIFLSE